jgi:C-methyltransferase
MLNAAQVTAVTQSAISLGMFPHLAAGPHDAASLAKKIDCPERSTRMLLEGMVVIGLVAKIDGRYKLTPLAEESLVPGRPMYSGDVAGILASPVMWNGLARLADAVKQGGSVLGEHAETPSHPFWETFAQSSASMAFGASAALGPMLADWIKIKKTVRVLDIAAGSGIYGFSLALAHPNVELTSLDWPNVLGETKQWAKKLGVDPARTHYIEGNLFEVDFRGPYDLVLLSHVYHHFDPPVCLSLSKKVSQALAPGGRAVVHDFLTDAGNPAGAMFALTMLMWTKKGEVYSAADYKKWLTEAGLTNAVVHNVPGMPTSFVLADKP